MRYFIAALLFAVVESQSQVVWGTYGDNYVVGVPQCIRPGLTADVVVDIIKRVRDMDVLVELYNKTTGEIHASSGTQRVSAGIPAIVSFQVPSDLPFSWRYNQNYYIRVTGTGPDLQFQNETAVSFASQNMTGFVQTDKPIYKPGQTVHIRIFSLFPDLQINKDVYDIEIRDAKNNKIRDDKGVTDQTGLIKASLELSDEPVFGLWSITARVHGNSFYKSFEVKEYVLPRVEVVVTPPSFIVKTQPTVEFTVDAKYTFGEDVRGTLLVTVKSSYWYSRNKGDVQPIIQRRIPGFVGSTTVLLATEDILDLHYNDYIYGINIEANLTETLTGSVATGKAYTRIHKTADKVTYESSSARTFKPPMTFTVYARLSQQDDTPIVGTPDKLIVQVQYTYPLNKSDISTTTTSKPLPTENGPIAIDPIGRSMVVDPIWWYPRYETRNLTLLERQVPSDGIVEINVENIPLEATSVSLTAMYKGQQYWWSAQRAYSPTNTFIQVIVVKQLTRPGQKQKLRVKSTDPITALSILIMARGRMVMAREETRATPSTQMGISFVITREMAPRAKIVVYVRTALGEIVPDVITFNVLDPFENKVSIGFSAETVQPGDDVTMTVRTAPNSLVATRVLDKKVLLLKSGNDITEEQVTNSLWSFDSCGYYGWWRWEGDIAFRRRKRSFIPWRYPYYGSGTDAASVFQDAGLIILTDSLVYSHNYYEDRFGKTAMPAVPEADGGSIRQDAPLQEVENLRTKFPETWLFMTEVADDNGEVNVHTIAPDSITSWQATAFAFNDQSGFGITPVPAMLTVVKPFFTNLFMPYSVIRGEELFLQVNVFNYMNTNQTVVVELQGSVDYEGLDIDDTGVIVGVSGPRRRTIVVPTGVPKSVVFPIRTLSLGTIPITVTARSTDAADGLTKTIIVEPEGVPSEYNFVELVNLTSVGQYTATRSITYPPGLVDGSQKLGVKLVGDPLGSTVANLANLVRLSYGCGEQNMVRFAPTIFVTIYLQAVSQLTDQRRDDALNYISQGYQRQMNYKRTDGSYSAFGDRDAEGSLWLTAFVAKSFSAAAVEGLLNVDEEALKQAYSFIISHQNKDGSFSNVGKLHNRRLQGQSGQGNGLTAYILTALLESSMADSFSSNIAEAQEFVESYVASSTDIYELAIGAYALALAGSTETDTVLSNLESRTTTRGGYTFWEVEAEPIYRWEPPARRTKAASIEATSYVCMVYAMKKDITRSSQCLTFLVAQQNDYGGFVSTQDTVVAVQALSAIGPFFYTETQGGSVTVEAATESVTFNVNSGNRLQLQTATLPVSANSVTVRGSGTGVFLVSISAKYNLQTPTVEPAFTVTATLTRDTRTAMDLSVCSKYIKAKASSMANIEIRLPSGFTLTEDSRDELLSTVKRVEVLDGKVLLYLDEITSNGVCVSLTAIGSGDVNNLKACPVRVFDYYTPDDSAMTLYRLESADGDFCDATVCASDPAGCSANCSKRRRK